MVRIISQDAEADIDGGAAPQTPEPIVARRYEAGIILFKLIFLMEDNEIAVRRLTRLTLGLGGSTRRLHHRVTSSLELVRLK